MRIAVFSDIHGNVIALDAVLADARALGVEQIWALGDFCAIGPEPAAVLEKLAELDNTMCTRGNTDRYVVTGEGPPPTLETVRSDPELIPTFAGIAASFAWTRGYLTARGWLDWLERLPLELRIETPAALRILAVHASPGTDDGDGVHPGRSNAELRTALAGADEDLILVGHTHEAMVRQLGRTTVVNLGSVSNPRLPDLRASYVLLEVSADGCTIEPRRVPYDHAAFAESVRKSGHPAAEFILSHQRGGQPARVAHRDHTPFILGETLRIVAGAR
jgi:putative phosphoesterase